MSKKMDWKSRKQSLQLPSCGSGGSGVDDDTVLVSKKDLAKLSHEIRVLKELVPHIASYDLIRAFGQIQQTEDELNAVRQELVEVFAERDHWRSRCELALAEQQKEQEEKFQLQFRIQESTDQLVQQSEYCASMGAACSTLLWRVSQTDTSVQTILCGTKVDEFLSMVGSTIQSYARIYKDLKPGDSEEETQFVLALCGVITNIAASAFGRDFLMKNEEGRQLLDKFVSVLQEVPVRQCTRMKTLMLMALYNISINQQGLKHLSQATRFITLLAWNVQEETDLETRLNSLRLIESLLYDDGGTFISPLYHEATEALTPEFLQRLSKDKCPDIQFISSELSTRLRDMSNKC